MRRNPTMVFAGSFWAGASEQGLADGFRSLGWAVQEVDSRDYGVNAGHYIALRLASRVLRTTARKAYSEEVLANCCDLKPSVFLTTKGVGISGDLLRRIKQLGTRTIMYYPDRDFHHPGVSTEVFKEYDLFITTKTFQVAHLQALLGADRVAYVPHGYSGSVHRPILKRVDEEDYRVDLLYPGNHSAYKQEWLENAVAVLPEYSVEIMGNRWLKNASRGPLSRCRMAGRRIGVAYAEAIQTARISISVHFGPAPSGWQDLVSTRTFEIPACRGFMLHIDNAEVREFFTPGLEIDVFSTPEELVDKIHYYLDRPELRTRMIERAYARAVPAYSYATRAKQITTLLEERMI